MTKTQKTLFVLRTGDKKHDGKLFATEASLRQYCLENGVLDFDVEKLIL